MIDSISPAVRATLGRIVVITDTGEYARARVAYGDGNPLAGLVELGMADGTVRHARPGDFESAEGFPIQMRAIPVYPDAADGSSRPMGLCSNEGCGQVESNVIEVVNTKGARYTCGAWYMKRADRHGKSVKAPTATVCTHCYALGRTPF